MGDMIKIKRESKGFTIVELMIATTVFSVVLVVLTYGVIEIGRIYYKNITSSRTQEAARSITEDVSRSLQLNTEDRVQSTNTDFANKAYCIGNLRYTYVIDRRVDPSTAGSRHALWVDEKNPSDACTPVTNFNDNPATVGKELIPTNMRLTQFNVSGPVNGAYTVNVGVGYGDNDLFTFYNDQGTTRQNLDSSNAAINEADSARSLCKGIAGSSFCAVSALSVVVKKRI